MTAPRTRSSILALVALLALACAAEEPAADAGSASGVVFDASGNPVISEAIDALDYAELWSRVIALRNEIRELQAHPDPYWPEVQKIERNAAQADEMLYAILLRYTDGDIESQANRPTLAIFQAPIVALRQVRVQAEAGAPGAMPHFLDRFDWGLLGIAELLGDARGGTDLLEQPDLPRELVEQARARAARS